MAEGRINNPFNSRSQLDTADGRATIFRLEALEKAGLGNISRLPFSIKILLEAVLRNCDGKLIKEDDVAALAAWNAKSVAPREVPFKPARVILQDFTGVPAVVDLAAMRSAMKRLGGDPSRINPLVPVDLVIDHSVQVDVFGIPTALQRNAEIEFQRNRERYEFLRWGQQAFANFRVVPPATGIVHQVNLEFLAKVVLASKQGTETVLYPDTLVGTDSHTTMINGLGVLGWGVGGIEAEAAMLGQPYYFLTPQVVGFKLRGSLREGVTATDLVLTVTEILRKKGVVDKFVEFYGEGLAQMTLPDRATIGNMSPEYGATMGFFPVDEETLRYLQQTGRTEEEVDRVERYAKEQGIFHGPDTPDPEYSETIELDLETVETSLAGPKRPQDRIALSNMKSAFRKALTAPPKERGLGLAPSDVSRTASISFNGTSAKIGHGAVVIAAITSCTNTSNPSVMLAAGLLAKKAVERGLSVPPYVKTSLAPGSRVVTEYLQKTGLQPYLDELGFQVVGYGCTTCIGNSGPLEPHLEEVVTNNDLVVASVLSGNRNFEARVHQSVKANFLMSPPLVVAFALAGHVDIDMAAEPIGKDKSGQEVYLKDLWPTSEEIGRLLETASDPATYRRIYQSLERLNPLWDEVPSSTGKVYEWDPESTYIQEPPYFDRFGMEPGAVKDIRKARALAILGDSVTTDHISPAGSIKPSSPAGLYLQARGVAVEDFNSYGLRRGNDKVMVRGTFANVRIKNLMVPGVEGGVTVHQPDGEQMSIYDAAVKYQAEGIPLLVFAGQEYGTGSSRDWAAKGTMLLGVRAVIAQSFERIHRSNLVGMGVLPCQFKEGVNPQTLHLDGSETFDLLGLESGIRPRQDLTLVIHRANGQTEESPVTLRIDTPIEVDYYTHGGILPYVLRQLIGQA